jgi:hypothetical protein
MAGATYTVDFWVACQTFEAPLSGGELNVLWGGAFVFHHLFPPGTSGYTEYTFNVTASTASTNLEFNFGPAVIDGAITLWALDDVSVNPAGVGVPDGGSTVSLLGCALLGLAALRRKLSC